MDNGVPIAHQALTVGQLGHFPGFHHQGAARQLCFEHFKILKHDTRSFLPGSPTAARQGGYSKGGPV